VRLQINWICLALLLSTPCFAAERVRPKLQGEWSRVGHQTRYKISGNRFIEYKANNPNAPNQISAINYPFGKSYAEVTTQNGKLKIYSGGANIIAVESFDKTGAFIDDGIIFYRHGKKDQINSDKSLQSAEQAYMNAIKGVAEGYERNLVELKDLRNGDLAEADQINEQIKKIRLEIERLEQWPKLKKTTWDMWPDGGRVIRRDFWSDGRVFDTGALEKAVDPKYTRACWISWIDGDTKKIQFVPKKGHFLDTFILSKDGKSIEGKNTDGTLVHGKRVGEPVFENRKPVIGGYSNAH